MFVTGVLCTVRGAQVYLCPWNGIWEHIIFGPSVYTKILTFNF